MSAFVTLQKLVPQHLLSRTAGFFAASELGFVRAPLIRTFARYYSVDMTEAVNPNLGSYRSFNDFFTSALAPNARPVDPDASALACPTDGTVSQTGIIENGELLQAKGIRYSFEALADTCAGPEFEGGTFLTVYLSPKDYHRVHIPAAANLKRTVAIPGELFSVNARTEAKVEGLFARNERLVCEFETAFGKMLVIMVGALIVASIETLWEGPPSPYAEKQTNDHDLAFAKGDEMGRFLLGSTVIVAFEKDRVQLDDSLTPGATVQMGQPIGVVK